ncbi:MAG: hypothetical protein U0Y82_08770 [Thermoleophilia bacterium]
MKKLLVLFALGGVVFWLLKDRLAGEPEEFVFTEAPVDDAGADQPAANAG